MRACAAGDPLVWRTRGGWRLAAGGGRRRLRDAGGGRQMAGSGRGGGGRQLDPTAGRAAGGAAGRRPGGTQCWPHPKPPPTHGEITLSVRLVPSLCQFRASSVTARRHDGTPRPARQRRHDGGAGAQCRSHPKPPPTHGESTVSVEPAPCLCQFRASSVTASPCRTRRAPLPPRRRAVLAERPCVGRPATRATCAAADASPGVAWRMGTLPRCAFSSPAAPGSSGRTS